MLIAPHRCHPGSHWFSGTDGTARAKGRFTKPSECLYYFRYDGDFLF
jgi:hypothetical protein